MTPDLTSYDSIIVAVSGGKDGLSCLFALLEAGAPKDRLELWHHEVDGQGPNGRRLRFPQVSASLTTRWRSSATKIDVADRALRDQERFLNRRTLFVTGERAEESPNRAR